MIYHKRDYAEALHEGLLRFNGLVANPQVTEQEIDLNMSEGHLTLKYQGRLLLSIREQRDGQCLYGIDLAVVETIPMRANALPPSEGFDLSYPTLY